MATEGRVNSVQCFGRKKAAVAVTHCKAGKGLIMINGVPIELVKPEILRYKAFEPIMLAGVKQFQGVDMRIRVRGGGKTSQIYAIRQSIAKALVAYYQKYVDEHSKKEVKDSPAENHWKDMGTGHLSIKCKEGVPKATKESKPTIIVQNDVGRILLNALIYPGIKMNIQKTSIVSIFHTAGGEQGDLSQFKE